MTRALYTLSLRLLLATALVPASALLAQDADPKETSGEDIIVTGYKAANRVAIEAKRNAEVVLDTISQDDIGRLPDLNIVESARRITGLSTVGRGAAGQQRVDRARRTAGTVPQFAGFADRGDQDDHRAI